jgi:hypothetical protein
MAEISGICFRFMQISTSWRKRPDEWAPAVKKKTKEKEKREGGAGLLVCLGRLMWAAFFIRRVAAARAPVASWEGLGRSVSFFPFFSVSFSWFSFRPLIIAKYNTENL